MHTDKRGSVAYVNDFDLTEVKRFYKITHSSIETLRAWQGHKREQKWFSCTKGAFVIFLITTGKHRPKLMSCFQKQTYLSLIHIKGNHLN